MGLVGHLINRALVPPSLLWRSILIVVLPLLILQIVLTVIFYNRHWDVVTRWLAVGVAGEVALAVELLEEAETAAERRQVLSRFREFHDLRLSIEPGGELSVAVELAGIEQRRLSHIDSKIVQGFAERLTHPFAIDLRSEMPGFVVAYVQLDDGLLRVLAPAKRLNADTTRLLMYWMIGASLVLVAIAIYYVRLQVRPIRELAKAVESFGRGEDVGDFRPYGPSEIRRAAAAFNVMRERILRHLSQRTEMLAAISHDLRTPLTRMRLELEMLASDDPMAHELEADVDDLIELVDTYLAFARGEEGETAETVELAALARASGPACAAGRCRDRAGDCIRPHLDAAADGDKTLSRQSRRQCRALRQMGEDRCRADGQGPADHDRGRWPRHSRAAPRGGLPTVLQGRHGTPPTNRRHWPRPEHRA